MASKLKPVPDLLGVWRPEQVPQPGTFVFIAGVSAYRYLDGSKDSLTLGQLSVSALTAHQIFRYFDEAYRHRTAALAEVTLLLAPTIRGRRACSTTPLHGNIHAGLGALPIAEQFFFIDACRNDIASLHELAMTTGIPVLDVRRRQLNRAAPILWASVPGASTFQPDEAEDLDTSSFFGRTLLDALIQRDAEFRPDCRNWPCKIEFFPTVDYTNTSMALQMSAPDSAPVPAGGIVRNVTVSQVPTPVQPQIAATTTAVKHVGMPASVEAMAFEVTQPPTADRGRPEQLAEITLDACDLESILRAARVFAWDQEWQEAGSQALRLTSQRWDASGRSL